MPPPYHDSKAILHQEKPSPREANNIAQKQRILITTDDPPSNRQSPMQPRDQHSAARHTRNNQIAVSTKNNIYFFDAQHQIPTITEVCTANNPSKIRDYEEEQERSSSVFLRSRQRHQNDQKLAQPQVASQPWLTQDITAKAQNKDASRQGKSTLLNVMSSGGELPGKRQIQKQNRVGCTSQQQKNAVTNNLFLFADHLNHKKKTPSRTHLPQTYYSAVNQTLAHQVAASMVEEKPSNFYMPEKKKGQKGVGKKSTSNLCSTTLHKNTGRNMLTVGKGGSDFSSERKKTVQGLRSSTGHEALLLQKMSNQGTKSQKLGVQRSKDDQENTFSRRVQSPLLPTPAQKYQGSTLASAVMINNPPNNQKNVIKPALKKDTRKLMNKNQRDSLQKNGIYISPTTSQANYFHQHSLMMSAAQEKVRKQNVSAVQHASKAAQMIINNTQKFVESSITVRSRSRAQTGHGSRGPQITTQLENLVQNGRNDVIDDLEAYPLVFPMNKTISTDNQKLARQTMSEQKQEESENINQQQVEQWTAHTSPRMSVKRDSFQIAGINNNDTDAKMRKVQHNGGHLQQQSQQLTNVHQKLQQQAHGFMLPQGTAQTLKTVHNHNSNNKTDSAMQQIDATDSRANTKLAGAALLHKHRNTLVGMESFAMSNQSNGHATTASQPAVGSVAQSEDAGNPSATNSYFIRGSPHATNNQQINGGSLASQPFPENLINQNQMKKTSNSFKKHSNGKGKMMAAVMAASQSPAETKTTFYNASQSNGQNTTNGTSTVQNQILVNSYALGSQSRSSPVRKKNSKNKKVAVGGLIQPPPGDRQPIIQPTGVAPPSTRIRTNTAAPPQVSGSKGKNPINAVKQLANQGRMNGNTVDPDSKQHEKKEPLFLPSTGIDLPFLKRRPIFIRNAPELEMVHSGVGSSLKLLPMNPGLQLASRPDFHHKLVYDCTYGGHSSSDKNGTLMSAGAQMLHNTSSVLRNSDGEIVNGRYFDKLPLYFNLKGAQDNTLLFESRFESGNLHRATQIGDFEYDLELKQDYGTVQYLTQWYFFRVSNTKKNHAYKFNIINLYKPDSLYNHGMKVLIYSKKEADQNQLGWHRAGYEIKYCQSKKKILSGAQTLYSLSFTIEFQHDQDQVFFANCYPYTYSDCVAFLKRICLPSYGKDRLRRTALCKTRAGNVCEMLIITNFQSSQDFIAQRKCVIISSRVHPGESNASFIMEGFIEYILGDELEARSLRNSYVFKIIPMLNPDGVIVGNYRCSLSGLDLNRQWQTPSIKLSPEIFAMKEMVRKTLECREIHLFVDIHGHSRAKNLFTYGNQQMHYNLTSSQLSQFGKGLDKRGSALGSGLSGSMNGGQANHREKVLPFLLTQSMDVFSFQDCSFNFQKCKESTGRVVMCREFGIVNSYTLECSLCGPTQGTFKDAHFTQKLLIEMGRTFCKTLQTFSDTNLYSSALSQIEDKMRMGVYSGGSLAASGIGVGTGSIYNTSSNLMATTAASSAAQPGSSLPFKSANYSMQLDPLGSASHSNKTGGGASGLSTKTGGKQFSSNNLGKLQLKQ